MEARFELDADDYGDLLSAIPDFVLVVDPEGIVRYINQVEEGYDRDDVIGSHAHDIIDPASVEVFDSALEHTLETGGSREYEVMVLDPNGSEAWYRSRTVALRRNEGVVAVMLVATNVTELKRAQTKVEDLRRMLPLCSWCDRIKNGQGEWEEIESYLKRETGTDVTHGLCPDCFDREIHGLPNLDRPAASGP